MKFSVKETLYGIEKKYVDIAEAETSCPFLERTDSQTGQKLTTSRIKSKSASRKAEKQFIIMCFPKR
jgi:hypothetical protein